MRDKINLFFNGGKRKISFEPLDTCVSCHEVGFNEEFASTAKAIIPDSETADCSDVFFTWDCY